MTNSQQQHSREKRMSEHILKCECGKYTLKNECHGLTVPARPPKFSLEDKYGRYRREVKKKELIKLGLA
jgi:H/ACA ribonucleoprotein complex subunit 3